MKTQFNYARFIRLLELDMTLIIRNNVLSVAAFVTLFYVGILQIMPVESIIPVTIILIFSDPVMLGFMFTGAMVLFEKSSNTLPALTVTPVTPGEYLWSKGISLTLIALAASIIMALAGVGTSFCPLYFVPAVVLSSLLFVFLGFAGVSRITTFNQYFIVLPVFMIPAGLPFLNYFEISGTWLWYIIPTQASIILFMAGFEGTAGISATDLTYAAIYLPLTVYISYLIAKKSFYKNITS